MRFLPAKIIVTALLIFWQADFNYSQNTTQKQLKDAASGYSFSLSSDFESKQSEEGFVAANSKKTVLFVIKPHNFQDFQKFADQANLGKDGFSIVGKIQDLDKQNRTFRASKQTPQGLLVTDTFVLFSPFGGGLLIVAFSDAANSQNAFEQGLKISKSVVFSKPVASELVSQLQNLFRGKHLLYLYTASGFSERTDIYLCPSGSFIYRTDSSSLSANGSGITAANADGNWKIVTLGSNASLFLQFNNGTIREYKISKRQANNEIGLNGNRYFVQNHNVCR